MTEPIVSQEPTVDTPTTLAATETPETVDTKTLAGSDATTEPKAVETPEAYDIKVPDGMELDQAMMEAFTPVFKELGITQEQAQKLADTYAPLIANKTEEARQQALKEYQETVEGWKKDTIKELGVDSAKKLAYAAKARMKFGDEEFKEMVNELGVGNHPALVRFLIKVGQSISEDKFPDSTEKGKSDPLKVMYPTMK